MIRRLKYFNLVLLSLLINSTVYSQLDTYLDLSTGYDDNLYLSPNKIGDLISDLDLRLYYTLKDSATTFYYNIDYISFLNTSTRNFFLNEFGSSYSKKFGENNKHQFYLGGNWFNRLNNAEYDYYNYNQIYLYTNQRFNLSGLSLKTGYNFRYRNYSNIPDLTNYQHYLFLQANKTFRTRTSLIIETDLGHKSFNGTETYVSTGEADNGRYSSSHTTILEKKIPSLSHLVLLTRVAQSLHDRVGIYVQYRRQISLTAETSYVNADGYFQDEELFDDPFSYNSSAFSSKLTFVLPKSINLHVGGSINYKNYITELAYVSSEDYEGLGDIRTDNKQSIYFNFSKTFNSNKKRIDAFQTYLNYSYVVNESNSYWYNYKNHSIGIGLLLNF
ncbi:MAG: hypothetical protein GQ468_04970 [Candidatus Scalindua sp.]|nr:hypothetical protein [Candidatus Scalindua sp.]